MISSVKSRRGDADEASSGQGVCKLKERRPLSVISFIQERLDISIRFFVHLITIRAIDGELEDRWL